MADKFKAIVINQEGESFKREIKELDLDFLDQGEVLIKVDFSDLNFKDALILNDGGKLVKDFPRIPGIDLSGKVIESTSEEFKKDDEVIVTGCRVGEIYHGGYSQVAKVNKDFLVKKPKNLTLKQSMILGTAGFTALLCALAVLKEALDLMCRNKFGAVCVVNENKKIIGILTDGDIRRKLLKSQKPLSALMIEDVIKICSKKPQTIKSKTSLINPFQRHTQGKSLTIL